MSEFVKDQNKQKASVVILTLSFEPEGIDEGMGHLHHGGQNIMDLLNSLGSSQYRSQKQRKNYIHFINSMSKWWGEEKGEKFECYLNIYTRGKMWLCSAGVKRLIMQETISNFEGADVGKRD